MMKKTILTLSLLALCLGMMAQPRIKQRDIVALQDSLTGKYTRSQSDRRYIRQGQAVTDTLSLSNRIDQKVDLSDERLSNARTPLPHSQSIATVTSLQDSLTGKYTRDQTDRRYYRQTDTELATNYFYTKAQVLSLLDSVRQSILDYYGATPPPQTSSLTVGLISLWEFNEAAGTTATDAKSSYNATLYGGTLVNQTGKLGACLTFDGVDDYARVASQVAAYDTLVSQFSIALWFRLNAKPATADRGIVFKGMGADPETYAQWAVVADPSATVNGVALRMKTEGLLPEYMYPHEDFDALVGQWHHVVITYSTQDHIMRFYIDGTLSRQEAKTGAIAPGLASQLTFGSLGASNYLNCSLDQTAIWSRAINASEVSAIYNAGNGKAYSTW